MDDIVFGIDTFSLYHTLTPKQVYGMTTRLRELGKVYTRESNYFYGGGEYVSRHFAKKGVVFTIREQKLNLWGVYITVHPALALGEADRSLLYQPKKKTFQRLMDRVQKIAQQIDCPYDVRDMKLYRVDVTANLVMDSQDDVDAYIHVLKKSMTVKSYKIVKFRKGDGKVNDYHCANAHSYKQACKTSAFFAYDKTAQLTMIDSFPKSLTGKYVLRLEIQSYRKAVEKWVRKEDMDNGWKIIHTLYASAHKMFGKYLRRMRLDLGDHYRYQDAVQMIQESASRKYREKMLFLLRKTSDCGNLNAAVDALKGEHDLNKAQVDRLYKKFAKLDLSPITLPNSCRIDRVESLGELLKEMELIDHHTP